VIANKNFVVLQRLSLSKKGSGDKAKKSPKPPMSGALHIYFNWWFQCCCLRFSNLCALFVFFLPPLLASSNWMLFSSLHRHSSYAGT